MEARDLAREQLAAVRAKLRELRALERSIAGFVTSCDTSCAGGPVLSAFAFGLSSLSREHVPSHWLDGAALARPHGRWRRPAPLRRPAPARPARVMRTYVMLSNALEHERLLIAQRLLSEIERRHGLPHPIQRELHSVIMDRFLAVYLPEAREGEPVPQALEYAFAPALTDALDLLRDVVSESPDGCGAALYVHDLDTGITADSREPH